MTLAHSVRDVNSAPFSIVVRTFVVVIPTIRRTPRGVIYSVDDLTHDGIYGEKDFSRSPYCFI